MPSTKPWHEIRDRYVSPERAARIEKKARRIVRALDELRRAQELTQAEIAETLDMTQPEVSKLEHRANLYVSTLRNFIEALGGTLELMVRFPNGETEIVELAPPKISAAPTRRSRSSRSAS